MNIEKDPLKTVNDLNAYLDAYPYITNRPKVHRGSNNYERFQIEKKGLELRKATLQALD